MPRILKRDDALEIAGQYLPRIANAIGLAFDDYKTSVAAVAAAGVMPDYNDRTSACLVHDYIKNQIRKEFAEAPDIKIDHYNGIFGMLISNKVFIRFKKLNPDLSANNVKTDQAENFDKQQLLLDGISDLTLLTAGYIPDATWSSIQSICLTCRHRDRTLWYRDLTSEVTQVSLFGEQAPEPAEEMPKIRIKAIPGKTKRANDKG